MYYTWSQSACILLNYVIPNKTLLSCDTPLLQRWYRHSPLQGLFCSLTSLFKPSPLLALLPTDIFLSCCGVDSPSVRCLCCGECLLPFAAVKTSCSPLPRSNAALILQQLAKLCAVVLFFQRVFVDICVPYYTRRPCV